MYCRKYANKDLQNMLKWAIRKWSEKYGMELTYPRVRQNLKVAWNDLELEKLEQETLEQEINKIIEN